LFFVVVLSLRREIEKEIVNRQTKEEKTKNITVEPINARRKKTSITTRSIPFLHVLRLPMSLKIPISSAFCFANYCTYKGKNLWRHRKKRHFSRGDKLSHSRQFFLLRFKYISFVIFQKNDER